MASDNLIHVDDSNFETEVLQSEQPVLVDFFATWCGPCKVVAPVIEALADHYAGKMKVAKCDVDQAGQSAANFGIQAVPTIMVFKGGEVVKTMQGAKDKAAFIKAIDPLL